MHPVHFWGGCVEPRVRLSGRRYTVAGVVALLKALRGDRYLEI